MTYLTLSDDEWAQIRAVLPIPKRGPKRPHDRATCAAFLFAQAAAVSLESLPLGQFPDSRFLRTTWARWTRDGAYNHRVKPCVLRLTLDGERVTGKATTTLPRWTHVRGV